MSQLKALILWSKFSQGWLLESSQLKTFFKDPCEIALKLKNPYYHEPNSHRSFDLEEFHFI